MQKQKVPVLSTSKVSKLILALVSNGHANTLHAIWTQKEVVLKWLETHKKHVYTNTKANNLTSKISRIRSTTHLLLNKSLKDMEEACVNNWATIVCAFTGMCGKIRS